MIADVLKKQPKRFAEFQKKHCCTDLEQWEDGRVSAPLTAAVEARKIGETRLEPLRADGAYLIFRRIAPGPVLPVKTLFDL